jgi:hypothetical protein
MQVNKITFGRQLNFGNMQSPVGRAFQIGVMALFVWAYGKMSFGQEQTSEKRPEQAKSGARPARADEPKIPKLNEIRLDSPIFAMLSIDPLNGSLEVVVMPDYFGGNARIGLENWDNPSVQNELKLTEGQLHKISAIKKKLANDLRNEMKQALKEVEHLYQAVGFQEMDRRKHEEAYAATIEVLSEEQRSRFQVLQRRSRLVQLGWEFVFQLLDRDPKYRTSADVQKKLEKVFQESRARFQERSTEQIAKFLAGLEEILDAEQVATVAKMVGDGKNVVRPIIEEFACQLKSRSNENLSLESDPLKLLRRQKKIAVDGTIEDIHGGGGSQTGNLARDVIMSAYGKIDLLGDAGDLFSELTEPNGRFHLKMEQRNKEISQSEGLYHRGEISEEVMNQRVVEAQVEFDVYLWKEVMGDLIPGLRHQVEQHLIQLEIQAIGFPKALTYGHLARHVKLTTAQRNQLDKYYDITRESIFRDTKAWTIELENEVQALLSEDQVNLLRTELSAFDNDAIIHGTPMLLLIPRNVHFPK